MMIMMKRNSNCNWEMFNELHVSNGKLSTKSGKAQRVGRPPPCYRRRTLVATRKNFVTVATWVSWDPV